MADLVPEYRLGDLVLTDYPYAVEFGGDHGAPETIAEVVQSLLADGDLSVTRRHGNRELSLVIHVEGADLAELATNEAALRAECTKPANELAFDPGDGFAPTSVFETSSISMRLVKDDAGEQNNLRRWELTLTAQPFARSAEPTVAAALSAGGSPATAVIDTCDSATGWSGLRGSASTGVSAGFWDPGTVGIGELDEAVTSPETWTLTRTGTVSFSTMPYLVAEVATLSPVRGTLSVSAVINGVSTDLPIISRRNLSPGSGNGYHEVVVRVPAASASSLSFIHTSAAGEVWQGVILRNLSQTNMPPGTSARQLSRLIDVGGTERTPASLHASVPSGFLGTTILHTMPFDGSGYTPDLRRWRALGNTPVTNADARKITGVWEPLHPNPVFSRTPAHSLPRGGYVLMAAVKSSNAGTFLLDYAVKSVIGGLTIGETVGSKSWTYAANTMTLVPLAGDLSLPIVRSNVLDVEVHLLNSYPGLTTLSVEEWWLFKVDDDCALSIVNTTEASLWLDSPDVNSAVPLVSVGPSRDTTYHPTSGLIAQGTHIFQPGSVLVTSVSDTNDYVGVDLSYYKHWHTNAAE